ncbi:MAG: sigma-54-dependent Fis family transcriptional regulator [Magnetococcales bacterium]|nr:sigma-54-dependent Fis family transcriptional regulator [Magnetococcales bacterium]
MPSQSVSKRLQLLQERLDQVNQAWTLRDQEALLGLFVGILPSLLDAEWCRIHHAEPGIPQLWRGYDSDRPQGVVIALTTGTIAERVLTRGEPLLYDARDPVVGGDGGPPRRNGLCMPIHSLAGTEILGCIDLRNRRSALPFTEEEDLPLLRTVARHLAFVLETARLNRDIIAISNQVRDDMELFRQQRFEDVELITRSQKMRDLLNLVHKVSAVPVNVFITGESGTGKEVIAQIIHRGSERRRGPFVAVNCSSIPEHLMESEFFGHEKGAFTGAYASRIGRFEEACEGTLFLDEIGDMPLSIQPKFLRALQEREGTRVGSNRTRAYDFRLISASYRDLREEVTRGKFREDLFFRLFSVEIAIPPLRERQDDIVPLAHVFLERTCQKFKKRVAGFAPETLDRFESYEWPGNVRQLQHEVERLVALAPEGGSLSLEHCSRRIQERAGGVVQPQVLDATAPATFSLAENRRIMETQLIRRTLAETGGNRMRAARLLGITRQSLHGKIRLYGLAGKRLVVDPLPEHPPRTRLPMRETDKP